MLPDTNCLRKITNPSQIKLANRIFRCDRELHFDNGENKYSVQIICSNTINASTIELGICVNDNLFYELSIDDKLIGHFLNDIGDIHRLNQFPKKLKNMAQEVAFENLLERFEKDCHCNSTLVELPTTYISNPEKIYFQFKIVCETDESGFFGTIGTDHEGASWLLEKYEQLPKTTAIKFGQIPLTATLECGYSLMKISEIASIEVNDIILMDDWLSHDKSKVVISIGPSLTLIGQVNSVKKIEILKNNNKPMENAMGTRESSESVLSDAQIDDIPVQLVFQIGETQLKFGELSHLQPGYTFELENELNQQVDIKANGKTIGLGELVEIGDRIGVRVVEFERTSV